MVGGTLYNFPKSPGCWRNKLAGHTEVEEWTPPSLRLIEGHHLSTNRPLTAPKTTHSARGLAVHRDIALGPPLPLLPSRATRSPPRGNKLFAVSSATVRIRSRTHRIWVVISPSWAPPTAGAEVEW